MTAASWNGRRGLADERRGGKRGRGMTVASWNGRRELADERRGGAAWPMHDRDVVERLARFAGRLRERGVDVCVSDEIDGAAALLLVDPGDRDEVRFALRVALKVRRADWDTFDELFRDFWAAGDDSAGPRGRPDEAPTRPSPPRADRRGPAPPWRWIQAIAPPADEREREAPVGDRPGRSADALLRRKPFDDWNADDLPAMERLLARAARRLKCRPSRRLAPVRAGGRVDLRRSFRRAVGTGGELFSPARRNRAREKPDVALLCDTSGSMDPHTRFLLTFALSLKRVVRRCEVFAFNTSLTRLTPWLTPEKIGPTLERLAAGVPDWSGGTRIGASLDEFVTRYADELVSAKTVVVVLSDGLDADGPAVLAAAMQAIRERARKVIWLNPLLGDPRYRPEARGMKAALPFVEHFVPAHDLESLERLLPLLTAGGRTPSSAGGRRRTAGPPAWQGAMREHEGSRGGPPGA